MVAPYTLPLIVNVPAPPGATERLTGAGVAGDPGGPAHGADGQVRCVLKADVPDDAGRQGVDLVGGFVQGVVTGAQQQELIANETGTAGA